MGRKNIERNEERNKEAGIEGKQNLKVGSSKENEATIWRLLSDNSDMYHHVKVSLNVNA